MGNVLELGIMKIILKCIEVFYVNARVTLSPIHLVTVQTLFARGVSAIHMYVKCNVYYILYTPYSHIGTPTYIFFYPILKNVIVQNSSMSG